MEHFREHLKTRAEYGTLLSSGEPPWWFRFSYLLQEQWSNPIFQRNWVRRRIGTLQSPMKAFGLTMLGSYLFNILLILSLVYLRVSWMEGLMVGFYTLILTLPGVLYTILLIRMFIACLISTSASMRSNLGSEQPDSVMSTPLSDRDFFLGETLPNIVGGMDLTLTFAGLVFALAIPFAVVYCVPYIIFSVGDMSFLWIIPLAITSFGIYVAYLVFTVLCMMMLMSFAVGRWIFGFSVFGAVAAALVHYGIVSLIALMPMGMYILGIPIRIGIIILAISLTVKSGIHVLGKFRRQGEYYVGITHTSNVDTIHSN